MGYDFFVFPADRAEDVSQAESLYEASPLTGTTTPGSAIARFRTALEAVPGLLVEPVTGTDATAYVCTGWSDPMAHLRTVAKLACEEGLSVLDVQLRALYDPRGSVDVAWEAEGGPRLTYLTKALLLTVVAHVAEGRYGSVTFARGDRQLTVRTGGDRPDAYFLWSWANGG
jgi:hypothetical protein